MIVNHITDHKHLPVELLLIAPLMALSTSVIISLAAGLVFLLLMILIAFSVSIIRHFISYQLRLPFLVLIIATWITLIEMGLMVYFYDLRDLFGIYMPLLAINSLVFAASEEFYLRSPLNESITHALRTGIIILLLFLVMGSVREVLIYGSLFRDAGLIIAGTDVQLDLIHFDTASGLTIMRGAPGAFICFGLVLGLWNYITQPPEIVAPE